MIDFTKLNALAGEESNIEALASNSPKEEIKIVLPLSNSPAQALYDYNSVKAYYIKHGLNGVVSNDSKDKPFNYNLDLKINDAKQDIGIDLDYLPLLLWEQIAMNKGNADFIKQGLQQYKGYLNIKGKKRRLVREKIRSQYRFRVKHFNKLIGLKLIYKSAGFKKEWLFKIIALKNEVNNYKGLLDVVADADVNVGRDYLGAWVEVERVALYYLGSA